MKIKKRDGRVVPFDQNKIIDAILKAFKSVDGDLSDYAYIKAGNIADYILETCNEYKKEQCEAGSSDCYLDVEQIQDLVEKGLMSTKRKDVAKEYVIYREERNKARHRNEDMFKQVAVKLAASAVENQNANVDEHSFGGRRGEAAGVVLKTYALDYVVSKMARRNHLMNRIYIHDLDSYILGMHNCLTLPIDDMAKNGVNTRQTDIRPANSINTFCQLIAVYFQLQSLQQFGGVSVSHIDWSAVPYIRKSFYKHFRTGFKYFYEDEVFHESERDPADISIEDEEYKYYAKAYKYAMDMTLRETQQAVEGMYHNLNTLQSRSGNQLPFTSINYGTCTLPEGRMMIKCLLEGSLEGIGKLHKTPIFPCGIFQMMKGVNREPGDPNYDLYRLALKSTAKRLYPNYANVDWSGNAGYDRNDPRTYFSTMGCRTANGWDINGFGQLKDGRGNICPVTIIMPTLAMEAKEYIKTHQSDNAKFDIEEVFLNILDEAIHEAKDMLIERFDYICSQKPSSASFMYENGTMKGYNPEEGIRSALKHGTLALG